MHRWTGMAWVGLLVAACSGAGAAPDVSVDSVAAAPPAARLAVDLPPGGLEAWLSDIEAGLPTMESVTDRWQETQRGLVDLYVSRQEYIEMYWGPSGRLQAEGGGPLAEGVVELESAFHQLLQTVMEQPPDTLRVGSAMEGLRAQISEVRRIASESGLILIPRQDSTMTRG